WIFESNGPEFVASGALMDLGPTFEATDGYDLEDVDPATLELWQSDGGLYAYRFSNSPFVMFVNTDRVSEPGQDNPADLLAAGRLVPDDDCRRRPTRARVGGGRDAAPGSADGSSCGLGREEMMDALSSYHDAVFEAGAIPGPGTSADFFAAPTTMTMTQISRA